MAWDNFKDNVFVINLEKDKLKLDKVNKSYNSEGIRINRIDAVYGRTLNSSARKNGTSTICNYICPDGLVGCGMSHMKTWKYICDNKIKYAMIIEDDTVPIKDFIKLFNIRYEYFPNDWDIMYMYCLGPGSFAEDDGYAVSALIGGTRINNYVYCPKFPLSTAGYCVTLEGAKKLLEISGEKVGYHIDSQMALYSAVDSIKSYSVYPFMIGADFGESGIGGSDSFIVNKFFNFNFSEGQPTMGWYLGERVLKIPGIGWEVNIYDILVMCIFIYLGKMLKWSLVEKIIYFSVFIISDSIIGTMGKSMSWNTILIYIAIICIFDVEFP